MAYYLYSLDSNFILTLFCIITLQNVNLWIYFVYVCKVLFSDECASENPEVESRAQFEMTVVTFSVGSDFIDCRAVFTAVSEHLDC